ncbi:MAG TPA: glycosyltransferase family 39 protein, partial [Anaerolineales bacterium]|nr:glycosyltransferase family 39 protein [Anaerolineales bacterium]
MMNRLRPFRIHPSAFIIIPLALYFAFALTQLNLPGLHNDEAVEAGLQAMQIIGGKPIAAFRDAGLVITGRTFPLMVQDYIGAFNVYFALPFFATFGNTVTALRLYTVCIGAITLGLTFGFVAETVSKRAAFVAAMLLAASPSFIFWQRQGVFVASLTATFTVAALWAGTAWAKRGGWKWAALLGLLCGAGLYVKLLFVWVIGGAVAALAI